MSKEEGESLFVIIPNLNIWNADEPGDGQAFLASASLRLHRNGRAVKAAAPQGRDLGVTVVDEVAPGDLMLVSMGEEERLDLQTAHPGVRVVPVVELEPLWLQRFRLAQVAATAAGTKIAFDVSVTDSVTGVGLPGVDVVALTDREQRIGFTNKTNRNGVARMLLPSSSVMLDSVEAFPPSGHWPSYAKQVTTSGGSISLSCHPIDLALQDVRGHFNFYGADQDGRGVKVAVIDSGASEHSDLKIAKGLNVIKGESKKDFSDALGHGTHVAGVIAGRGIPGKGVRGVAPAVELHVYRVFGKGQETAISFNIAKAIRQAVDDGCDLINLSLGGQADVPDVLREIQRGRAMGVVCIAATGNDYRGGVNYPARYSQVLGISALGRKGTWPTGSAQDLVVEKPFGTDTKNFVASFSNVGSEVDLVGPGVGVVSTYPGGYAVMDGTSMACPVMTGAVARLLGGNLKILNMNRDQKRSDAIVKLARKAAKPMGFAVKFEGSGILV